MITMQVIPIIAAFSVKHMVLIGLAILFLFGGRKIPELMRGLGRGIREFQDAKDGLIKDPPSANNVNNSPTSSVKNEAAQ